MSERIGKRSERPVQRRLLVPDDKMNIAALKSKIAAIDANAMSPH